MLEKLAVETRELEKHLSTEIRQAFKKLSRTMVCTVSYWPMYDVNDSVDGEPVMTTFRLCASQQ